jgi:hypothetical protein
MASEHQINANRQNAQRSGGPSSVEGKDRASRNAMKHGLTARKWLLVDEDPELLEILFEEAYAYFKPVSIEYELVDEAIEVMWRLRRVKVFETALINWQRHKIGNDPFGAMVPSADAGNKWHFARALDVLLEGSLFKLNRYETSLQRRLAAIVKQIQDLQKARMGAEVQISAKGERGDVTTETPKPSND